MNARRLEEVPYTASLAHTMNVLVANSVAAVLVAALPGQWIGTGMSVIMDSDKQTGTVRKHYIGMVTMLDILAHIAGDDRVNGGGGGDGSSDLDQKMAIPVSNIIGHCLEGLSLWTLNHNPRSTLRSILSLLHFDLLKITKFRASQSNPSAILHVFHGSCTMYLN